MYVHAYIYIYVCMYIYKYNVGPGTVAQNIARPAGYDYLHAAGRDGKDL